MWLERLRTYSHIRKQVPPTSIFWWICGKALTATYTKSISDIAVECKKYVFFCVSESLLRLKSLKPNGVQVAWVASMDRSGPV